MYCRAYNSPGFTTFMSRMGLRLSRLYCAPFMTLKLTRGRGLTLARRVAVAGAFVRRVDVPRYCMCARKRFLEWKQVELRMFMRRY
jgi:hypothetical protein